GVRKMAPFAFPRGGAGATEAARIAAPSEPPAGASATAEIEALARGAEARRPDAPVPSAAPQPASQTTACSRVNVAAVFFMRPSPPRFIVDATRRCDADRARRRRHA